ncbi:DUF483 domain-containing protein [Candidatus Micrarchaeota archaeon]|nr:DUF483 domain-containing protein [Candidatus Micrarchaeota archaeon]
MFEQYTPQSFCRDYAEMQGSTQLPMFMAVVKGLKPLMDDWVAVERYQDFKQICKKYHLYVTPNCIFRNVPQSIIEKAEGKEILTTTKSQAIPFDPVAKDSVVHLYISGSKEVIKEAPKFGWYTLIVDDAVVSNPLMDNLKYGLLLGYPKCCVRFFINDTQGINQVYEAYKNTHGEPSFYCNPFSNDFHYFLIHNYPCSFRCRETTKQAKELLKAIKEEEPEYAAKIEYHLKLPLLVFHIRDAIAFEGKISKGEIRYSDSYFLSFPNIGKTPYKKFLEGNRVRVTKDKILIFKNETLLHSLEKSREDDGFLLKFS